MASQVTGVSIVHSTVCSGVHQHQRSESLAFVSGIHRWSVDSPHKRPETRTFFFHLMTSSCGPGLGNKRKSCFPNTPKSKNCKVIVHAHYAEQLLLYCSFTKALKLVSSLTIMVICMMNFVLSDIIIFVPMTHCHPFGIRMTVSCYTLKKKYYSHITWQVRLIAYNTI